MVGNANVIALLKALRLASWRDFQSFRSIAGQNFFLFAILVAYQQPESAEFFFVIFFVVMLFPLSADVMEKIPSERRAGWPLSKLEWAMVRIGSFAFYPIAWLALLLLLRAGWRIGGIAAIGGAILQAFSLVTKRFIRAWPAFSLRWIPAPPGIVGALMRLQWREMLATLDPYIAFALMGCTEVYRVSGRRLDPAAPQILSLLVVLAMSTEAQVLFAIDGAGAERFTSGVAVLAIGHRQSVLKSVPQERWRFTSEALLPDGFIQTMALFVVGLEVKSMMLPLVSLCFIA